MQQAPGTVFSRKIPEPFAQRHLPLTIIELWQVWEHGPSCPGDKESKPHRSEDTMGWRRGRGCSVQPVSVLTSVGTSPASISDGLTGVTKEMLLGKGPEEKA